MTKSISRDRIFIILLSWTEGTDRSVRMGHKKDQHSYPIYFPANPYIIPSQPSLQSRWQNIMIFLVHRQQYCQHVLLLSADCPLPSYSSNLCYFCWCWLSCKTLNKRSLSRIRITSFRLLLN